MLGSSTFVFAALLSPLVHSEDIDVYVGSTRDSTANPNVLIVLDNTSNWARQSQKWPGGLQQGQSEVRAIKEAVNTLGTNINIGLFEFVTGGNANDDGGYVRHHITPLDTANKAQLTAKLDTIFDNINEPIEKRNSNTAYGNLLYDVHNYLIGGNALTPTATPASLADARGYATTYSQFQAPLNASNTCAGTVIIFIGNTDSQGPEVDSAANTTALGSLGGNTSQLNVPNFTTTTQQVTSDLGYTTACTSSAPTSVPAEFSTQCESFISCAVKATSTINTLSTCAAGTLRYRVVGTGTSTTTTTISDNNPGISTADQTTANRTACVKPAPTAGTAQTCPAVVTSSSTSGNRTTTTTTAWSSCYTSGLNGDATGCTGGRSTYPILGTKTVRTVVTETSTFTGSTDLGNTKACYSSLASCSTSDYNCSSFSSGCACQEPGTDAGTCPSGQRYLVQGTSSEFTVSPTGTFSAPSKTPVNADEWARFFHQKGVTVPGVGTRQVSTYTIDVFNAQQNADQTGLLLNMAKVGGGKYFAARNENQIKAALLQIFAEIQSVNSTFASASLPVNATNRAQNENQVFIGMFRPDPQALPRWAGNMKRYQLINNPSLLNPTGGVDLGDVNGDPALSSQTGFLADCAISYWTTDSGNYWENVPVNPTPRGQCAATSLNPFSDMPDGPRVEKGATAEVIRKGNNPPATNSTPTFAVNRSVLTHTAGTAAGAALPAFNTSNSLLPQAIVDFIRGEDVNNEDNDGSVTETRPSLHGDVIHSRPQPINYGSTHGVVVYYGANDGSLHAVDADDGRELWAFVAPEFFSTLSRLKDNSPQIRYPNSPPVTPPTPTPTPKNYYFDGSIGVYQNELNATIPKTWIFPTMRRGGRMVYGLDVSNPTTPKFLWKAGCPNLADDVGCTSSDLVGIGQTWAIPNVAFIKGYSTTRPVVVVGGGYDACEDADTATPSCGSAKGARVFILDAQDGTFIKSFTTDRSVSADVALIDMDFDGYVDYAYAADLGGALYRMSFIDGPGTRNPLAETAWTQHKIAATTGGGRKFLFTPALFPANSQTVYLAIGSGDREHPLASHYPFSSVTNRLYVYKDDLANTTVTDDLDSTTTMQNASVDNGCNSTNITPGSVKDGWFINLNENGPGEQTVTSAVIAGGSVIFSTNRPIPPSPGTCTTNLGEARGYFLNLLNGSGGVGVTGACGGSRSAVFTGGGLPPSPVVAQVPIDGVMKTVVIGGVQKLGGASSPIGAQQVIPAISSVRNPVYWFKSSGSE